MTTATELWQARQISNLRKDQIMRNELDLARLEVEKMAAEITQLTADNAELRRMCEIVERVIGERDRARDLAVRAGAFDNDRASLAIAQLQEDVDTLSSELGYMERERDQALYERDQAREAVEFSRGLIPTRAADDGQ